MTYIFSVIKKVFKSIFPSKFKTIDSHKHHNKPKLELDKHDQDVMDIMNSPYAKTLCSRKFTSSFIDAIFAATNNLYLIAK